MNLMESHRSTRRCEECGKHFPWTIKSLIPLCRVCRNRESRHRREGKDIPVRVYKRICRDCKCEFRLTVDQFNKLRCDQCEQLNYNKYQREWAAAHRKSNPEHSRRIQRAAYARNPEKRRESTRRWRRENPELCLRLRREDYYKHADKRKATTKAAKDRQKAEYEAAKRRVLELESRLDAAKLDAAAKRAAVGRPSKAADYERGQSLHLEHPKWSWKRIAEIVTPEDYKDDAEGAGEAMRVGVYRIKKKAKATRI